MIHPPEIPPLGRYELYSSLGLISAMEPDTEELMWERAEREFVDDDHDSPHSRAWHLSFHASQFPGDESEACARRLVYTMMNIPSGEGAMAPWVTSTGAVGKAGEMDIVDAWYKGGRMLGVPEDPVRPDVYQLGFVDREHWLTGSTDLAILKKGWTRPHIVEIKCLAAETKILTRDGSKPIGDLAFSEVEIINGQGNWQLVPIREFGTSQLMRVTLESYGRTKEIFATPNHRWLVQEGKHLNGSPGRVEYITTALEPGMKMYRRTPKSMITKGGITHPSPIGIAQGLVYGDGTVRTSGGGGSMLDLFGHKKDYLRFFQESHTIDSSIGTDGIRVCGLPKFFKTDLPSLDQGTAYLYGWLAGYFGADGTVSKSGGVYLDCAQRVPLEYVRDICTLLGIITNPIYDISVDRHILPSGVDTGPRVSYRLKIDGEFLTPDFFIAENHRRRWVEWHNTPRCERSNGQKLWKVVSVEMSDRVEPVYCAIVEGSESFVLEDFILTGNSKADDVLVEMIDGRPMMRDGIVVNEPRPPDESHVRQLKATLGLAHEYDWGWATVCRHSWRILKADLIERLDPSSGGLVLGRTEPSMRGFVCPEHDYQCLHTFQLEPPTTGEIYYWSRSWPRGNPRLGARTKSFFYEYDPAYMAAGREVLREAKEHFEAGTLPPRHRSFQWSVNPCGQCRSKPYCRLDEGLEPRKRKPTMNPVKTLAESKGVVHAKSVRPNYELEVIRERVLSEWREET